jgi:hypothetical protein
MNKVTPYEHRGELYRELTIRSQADALVIAQAFREEQDVWLRKILASKLLEKTSLYDCGLLEYDLREAVQCRINQSAECSGSGSHS